MCIRDSTQTVQVRPRWEYSTPLGLPVVPEVQFRVMGVFSSATAQRTAPPAVPSVWGGADGVPSRNSSSVGTPAPTPVSYTHLDVYKRQGREPIQNQ